MLRLRHGEMDICSAQGEIVFVVVACDGSAEIVSTMTSVLVPLTHEACVLKTSSEPRTAVSGMAVRICN